MQNKTAFLATLQVTTAPLGGIGDVAPLLGALGTMAAVTGGQAHFLQSLPGKTKSALIMRTDLANVYSTALQSVLFSKMAEDAAEQAVRLDAAGVIVNLIQLPGHPEVTAQCIENILRLKPQCDRFCMPMIVEPLVFQTMKRPEATWYHPWIGANTPVPPPT